MLALLILSGISATTYAFLTTKVSPEEIKEMLESDEWFY